MHGSYHSVNHGHIVGCNSTHALSLRIHVSSEPMLPSAYTNLGSMAMVPPIGSERSNPQQQQVTHRVAILPNGRGINDRLHPHEVLLMAEFVSKRSSTHA